jgi:hypothetical protein
MAEVDMSCRGDIFEGQSRHRRDVLMSVRPIIGDAAASGRHAGGDRSDEVGR